MNAISSSLRVDRQEDAHEFLKELLDASMRADAFGCGAWASSKRGGLPLNRKLEMGGAVHAACGGVLQSGVKCGSCGHESLTMEPFYDISVGCENTVEKALGKYTAPERMAGTNAYRCEGCKKKVVASKRYQVRTASNSLMVHCNRFIGTRKDRRKMLYVLDLDLAPFMAEKPAGGKMLYNLVGVVVHQGNTTMSGHYFSYIKGSNGTWALKNDTTSRVVSESEVLNQQAYILLYARDAVAAAASAPASKTSAFDVVKKVFPQAVSRMLSSPLERTADQAFSVPSKAKVSPKVSPKSSPKKRERVSPYSGARRAQSSDDSVGRKARELPADVPAPSQPVKGKSQDIFLHSEPEPEDGVIRTFISGGSNAVRLLARKVLNYRAGSPSGSSSGGAKEGKAMSDGCGSGTDQGSFDFARIEPPAKSRAWLSPRLSPRSKSPRQLTDPDSERRLAIAAEILEEQKTLEKNDPRCRRPESGETDTERKLAIAAEMLEEERMLEKMNPWKVGGENREAVTRKVGLWGEDDSMQGQFGSARLSNKSLQKRSRAQDGGDADYDRGKEKKVRRKDARSNTAFHSGESWVYVNPFDAAGRAPIG